MPDFTTTDGRTFTIALNMAVAKRIRDTLKIDLLAINDRSTWETLQDPYTLVAVLRLASGADKAGLDLDAFGELLGGESLENASRGFMEALRDFFPSKGGRMVLQAALEAMATKLEEAERKAASSIQSLLPASGGPDQGTSGSSASGSPVPSASSHGGSPSGSLSGCTSDASGSQGGTPPGSATHS